MVTTESSAAEMFRPIIFDTHEAVNSISQWASVIPWISIMVLPMSTNESV